MSVADSTRQTYQCPHCHEVITVRVPAVLEESNLAVLAWAAHDPEVCSLILVAERGLEDPT